MANLEKTVSTDYFKTLLDRLPMGVCICDLFGTINYANNSFSQMQGYSDANQILNKKIFELSNLGKVSAQMQTYLKAGKEFVVEELKYANPDKREGYFTLRASPLQCDGQIIGILSWAEDVTNRVKLKEEIKSRKESNERLLRVEKLSVMGKITSQVAHEIRNPITIIGGFANSMLRKLDRSDANYEYLKIISQESQRVENILNNVLNFTRPEKAKQEESDINEIVEQTLDMLQGEIEGNKISIEKELSNQLPWVWINPDQIRHALVNVFKNAICAMSQGGILRICTQLNRDNIKLNIADTGSGIPKDNLGSIFKAFYTTRPDSDGLGLTVASEIIKNHNGSIGVESEEGKGTTFYIEFPLKKEG